MRKIFFSIFLLSFALCAKATYYTGTNQMAELLWQIKDDAAGKPVLNTKGELDNSEGSKWSEKANPGFIFKSSLAPGNPSGGDGVTGNDLGYWSNTYTYFVLRAIDWRGKGYIQSPYSTSIALTQPTDISSSNSRQAEDNELRWLQYVDFSGNRFHTVEINGGGLLDQLELIDLSNNPTLRYLDVIGCPNPYLRVDISNNGFSFGDLYNLFELGGFLDPIPGGYVISPKLVYAPQGLVYRAFPFSNIDLSNDADGFSKPTTYEFTDIVGTPITPTAKGGGKFALDSSYDGQKIYCTAKCAFFSDMPEGLTFLITLTDDPLMLRNVEITPSNPEAYVGVPIACKAAAFDFEGNTAAGVTVKWESDGGTFDNDVSFTPHFTPTIEGNVEVKCTATQKRSGKLDVVEIATVDYNVNAAPIITFMDVQFDFDVYLVGEDAKFTIQTIDQYGTHNGSLNGVKTSTTGGIIDRDEKTFTCFTKSCPKITFEAGDFKQTFNLYFIDDNPLVAADAKASSFDPKTDDGYGNPRDHSPAMTIDGDRTTRWASNPLRYDKLPGFEYLPDDQDLIIIDLGAVYNVCMIEVDWEVARASLWELSVSEDGIDWSDFWGAYYDTDMANINGHYISRAAKESKARYIQIECFNRASDWDYSIYEITAYQGELPNAINPIKPQSGVYYKGEVLNILGSDRVVTNIYTLAGQKVMSSTASAINVASLEKGCYIAKITNANGTVSTAKFIKY